METGNKPIRIELNTNGSATAKLSTVKIDGIDVSVHVRSINISAGVGTANSVTIQFVNVDVLADDVLAYVAKVGE
jgi:hypothetical protein